MKDLFKSQRMPIMLVNGLSLESRWNFLSEGMRLSIIPLITALTLLLHSGFVTAGEVSDGSKALTVSVDHNDGGKRGKRHMRNLLAALDEEGCNVTLHDPSMRATAQLLFDSRPSSVANEQRPEYRSIARAKTLDGALTVRGAVLVHASTGIKDLASLQGEWVSFVSKNSWPGYRLTLKLLQAAGVNESRNDFYFVGNHVGALSALLHNDVHVAVIAEPLAQRWAEQNSLSIVAVSDEAETGGWWMHRSVSEELTQRCAQALIRLEGPRLKVMPAWVDGFVISE